MITKIFKFVLKMDMKKTALPKCFLPDTEYKNACTGQSFAVTIHRHCFAESTVAAGTVELYIF